MTDDERGAFARRHIRLYGNFTRSMRGVMRIVNRRVALTQEPCAACRTHGIDFSDNRQSNLFGRLRADVQTDWAVKPRERGFSKSENVRLDFFNQPERALTWAEDAQITDRRRQQRPQQSGIVQIIMGHDNNSSVLGQRDLRGRVVRPTEHDLISFLESFNCGAARARVNDCDMPANYLRLTHEP